MHLLTIVGSADLALGRLYKGHVGGLLLVARYGTAEQMQRFADCCHDGMLSGVWNTGGPELLKLLPEGAEYRFKGIKLSPREQHL